MNIIKEMRKKFGLTQREFSEITNIPKRTVESWEEEKRIPPEWLPKMIECWLAANLPESRGEESNDKQPTKKRC